MPGLAVVPPALGNAGRTLLDFQLGAGGERNERAGTAGLLVSPWLN
ncbi:MAG: Mu-like prophage major head subunit gpT family protein [Alkalilacustris sp.]